MTPPSDRSAAARIAPPTTGRTASSTPFSVIAVFIALKSSRSKTPKCGCDFAVAGFSARSSKARRDIKPVFSDVARASRISSGLISSRRLRVTASVRRSAGGGGRRDSGTVGRSFPSSSNPSGMGRRAGGASGARFPGSERKSSIARRCWSNFARSCIEIGLGASGWTSFGARSRRSSSGIRSISSIDGGLGAGHSWGPGRPAGRSNTFPDRMSASAAEAVSSPAFRAMRAAFMRRVDFSPGSLFRARAMSVSCWMSVRSGEEYRFAKRSNSGSVTRPRSRAARNFSCVRSPVSASPSRSWIRLFR